MGSSIGTDGLPPLFDRRGTRDRHGRPLETTETATADAVAAAADLVAGQAGESRPVILLRGLRFEPSEESSGVLLRQPDQDLYA
jgi:coenzyme F420-0:L-glutamate ligase/coenzyme F420-1:gamma-L-glutamate ligase